MEPLTVLREFASSGRLAQVSLSLDARTVKFGDQFEFGADAPTRWRAKGVVGANAASTAAATLPLGALAFFATSPTFFDKAPWGDYLKNARSAGFATVPVVDRKVNGMGGNDEGRKRKRKNKTLADLNVFLSPPPSPSTNLFQKKKKKISAAHQLPPRRVRRRRPPPGRLRGRCRRCRRCSSGGGQEEEARWRRTRRRRRRGGGG